MEVWGVGIKISLEKKNAFGIFLGCKRMIVCVGERGNTMKSNALGVSVFAICALLSVATFAADTWYVSASNFGKSGLDGKSESTAWGTLQDAHDNAAAGDTIKVLEGTYDKGEKYDAQHTNRLVVSKKLFFEAAGTREKTHIVGKHATVKTDGTPSTDGRGKDAIRCVCVTADGYGSIFTGFTFRDGASSDTGNDPIESGGTSSGGGAINVRGKASTYECQNVYFVDCVISNSVAGWGGAMRGGVAIRCLIVNNKGNSYGGVCCSAGLWNSVVVGVKQLYSSARPACGNYCRIVNSTIAATSSTGLERNSVCYNTLFTSCGGTAMSTYSNSTYYNCTNSSYGVFSPATLDFRPVAGLEADNTGNTEYLTSILTLPEGIEMKDFNGNPIDLTRESCDIGAVQGAVENAGGAVELPLGTKVDGVEVPLYKTTYARSTDWPKALVLEPSEENFFSYTATGNICDGLIYRFLQRDGMYHMITPPFANQVIKLAVNTYKYEYWCNPDADASTADGSIGKPFRTIQDAIIAGTNAMAAASGFAVVNLLPGDYREGKAWANAHWNRFVVPRDKSFLIRSTSGPENTTVYGEADPNPVDECYAGCGPNAMRCGCFEGGANGAVQGITFTDGHSNFADNKNDAVSDRCGGIYADTHQILDCVFTNCTAPRGAIGYWGRFIRCKFYDSVSYTGCFRYGRLSACYVDPSCRNGSKPAGVGFSLVSVIGSSQVSVLCTAPVSYLNSSGAYSMLFGDQKAHNLPQWGSVFRSVTEKSSGATGYAALESMYVDFENGDLRLRTDAYADTVSAETIGERGSESWGKWASNITAWAQSDLNGRRLKVTNGKLLPGCFHETADGVCVYATKGGTSVDTTSKGVFVEDVNLPLVVRPVAGTRPCIGFLVNGVTNKFDDADNLEITFTAADVESANGALKAEAIYTKDWYADPNGSNDNCGFTPKTAKKTLAAAMAMTAEGDTVHAAEGRYDEGYGSAKPTADDPESRVYIPYKRELVADGDMSKTFIVGRRGTDEFTDELGCGSNSVRCVYMAKETLLKGFTLVDGYAFPANGKSGDYEQPFNGGAIFGTAGGRDTTIVQDCVISNCAAFNYAAGREVSFVNCFITGNKAKRGITSECYHFGCVIDGNWANVAALHFHTRVVDTTVGPNAFKLNGTAGVALGSKSTDAARILNSLILGKCTVGELVKTVSNCVFVAGMGTDVSVTNNSFNCRFASSEELQVDENLRPIAGKNVACDMADAEAGDSLNERLTGIYMALRARANNGNRLDAGALEADWSGRYANDVGGLNFSVSVADNAVEESPARTVLIPDGARFVGEWSNGSGGVRTYAVNFVVPEGGSLSVKADGVERTFSAGTHSCRLSSAGDVPIEFAAAGGTVEILRGGWIRGTIMAIR